MVGPHPDDFDAIGITMKFLFDRGNAVEAGVAFTGSGVEAVYPSAGTPAANRVIREKEQRASCRFFGLADESLTFLDLERDDTDQPLDTAGNRDELKKFMLKTRPDLIFLPHGNDSNSGHRNFYTMVHNIASEVRHSLVLFLNRDPKTVKMRIDLYTPFAEEEAVWKAELLRFHDSQQQRNLNSRGHGFDERILELNHRIAKELSLDSDYAEAFELEFHNIGRNPHESA